MIIDILAMVVSISISGVAAWYSIAGLTAIFSGAVIPIVIMGTVLEFGKIVTTVWLHSNWEKVGWFIRTYLSVAVIALMFVTSMGIFGFLSRAHIDATSGEGDNLLRIEQLDGQIAVERSRIQDSQRVIAQMDTAVTNILNQSSQQKTLDGGRGSQIAAQANQLRNTQKKERDLLNKTIDETNARITELSDKKFVFQQSQAKNEAEVGPVKFIAQFIYGDTVNKDLLERAVRWVIIIIVSVFDPLAVCLILAVTTSMNLRRRAAKTEENVIREEVFVDREVIKEVVVDRPVEIFVDREVIVDRPVEVVKEVVVDRPVEVFIDREVVVDRPVEIFIDREVIVDRPVEIFVDREVTREIMVDRPVEVFVDREVIVDRPVEVIKEVVVDRPVEVFIDREVIKEVFVDREVTVEKIVEDHSRMAELASEIDSLLVELRNKENVINNLTSRAKNGYLRCLPIEGAVTIQKWNGDQWISVDKEQNSSYLADSEIMKSIVELLAEGKLIWDLMTDLEIEEIKPLLKPGHPYFGK